MLLPGRTRNTAGVVTLRPEAGIPSHGESDNLSAFRKAHHWRVNTWTLNSECKAAGAEGLGDDNPVSHPTASETSLTVLVPAFGTHPCFSAQLSKTGPYALLLKALLLTRFELIKLPPNCVVLFPLSPLFPFNKLLAEAQETEGPP